MTRKIRLLLVEDDSNDADLVLRELGRAGFTAESTRVETEEGVVAALAAGAWDLVISDYRMPGFDALGALACLRRSGLDLPFIVVSGAIGEDLAVEAMKSGAHDYVMKGNLSRLGQAVERELRDAKSRAEQRIVEEELRLSDRMVSVGTLAAGIGHELNNPLTVVMANLDFVRSEIVQQVPGASDSLESIREAIAEAREAADRVRQIVRGLKVFSRADEEGLSPVDLERILDSATRMSANEIRHRARLTKHFEPVPKVVANETRLGQVFLSLLVNAAQAIPEGHVDANEIAISLRTGAAGAVVVEIRDTGETRRTSNSSGLALARRLVTGFGGTLAVEPAKTRGTVMRVELPASAGERTSRSTEMDAPSILAGARILVVDDEPMVVKAIRRMLPAPHQVESTAGAAEALAKIRGGAEYDLILCDLMMPEMTGIELHHELQQTHPAAAEAMVFITGGAFTSGARAFFAENPGRMIEKPFTSAQVLASVAESLRP